MNNQPSTGIELIANERKEQILKHGYTGGHDVQENNHEQLASAALGAIIGEFGEFPASWSDTACLKIINKTKKERLIIAGALLAAEIDRLTNLEMIEAHKG